MGNIMGNITTKKTHTSIIVSSYASEMQVVTDMILKLAESERLNRQEILNDLLQYRLKSGPIFGDPVM